MSKKFNIRIPTKIDPLFTLLKNANTKHEEDGAASLLNNQQNFNMTDFNAKRLFAFGKHEDAIQKGIDREDAIEQRNFIMGLLDTQNSYTEGTVLFYVTSLRDDLLGEFRGIERRMGAWGYHVNYKSKRPTIVISRSPAKLYKHGRLIVKRHEEDGVNSILDDAKVMALKDLLDEVELLLEKLETMELKRKAMVGERNRTLGIAKNQNSKQAGTLYFMICCIREVLLGNFRGNEMQLGLWGFQVQLTSPSTPSNPDPDPDPEPTTANLSGKVLNAVTQEFVSGVTIQFVTSGGTILANSTALGDYAAVLPLEAGELITVEINHPGFQPFSEPHFVSPGDELVFDFNLQPN